MRLMTLFAAAVLSLPLLAAAPARIIFDTDMCGDYDDVGALAALNALADAGECEILGIVSSTRASPALGMAEMISSEYGRTNLPMGVCRELGVSARALENDVGRVFRAMVADRATALRYPSTEAADDANAVYRKLLASSPDGSVTLCTVGFLTNVRRLLETAGDDLSPLSGRDLVARKVKAWYAMGGVVPRGLECNLSGDAASSARALAESPVPVVFVDFALGADVLTGLPVARQGLAAGPVAEAFIRAMKVWNEERKGRPSWDELTVLAAVRGTERYFAVERGTMTVDPLTGSNTWTRAATGPHALLSAKVPKAALRDTIDALIARRPACRETSANPKPFAWWHWCGTAVTKEGIVRDLEAMREAGIGGATIFQVARGPCSEVAAFGYEDDTREDFAFGSDAWWDFVAFAAREARKRGIEIGMHNCPGYTVSGGPWITPELAMKKLVWTSAKKGETPPQPETNLGFYREIGTLEKGERVYRFGYTCTLAQCMPVAMALYGHCLEADKMSAKAINCHLDHILSRDLGLDFILMDSYEAGDYDWTDDFRAEFTRRRGYDPLPSLPAYVGAETNGAAKIRADMARTVGELSTERHYGLFRDRLHAKGLKFFVEPYGGPFDRAEAAWASDQPTTEFWGVRPFWVAEGTIGGNPQLGGAVGRAAGRTILAAEAYTAMPFQDPYLLSPRDFKAVTDASFARGINRMFLHHWVHQPFPADLKPGMNMGYWGAHFGENATWFEPGKAFFDYLTRCQERLQQGEEVIDVLAVEDFRGLTDGVDIVPRRVFLERVGFAAGLATVKNPETGHDRHYPYLAVPTNLRADAAVAAKVAAATAAGVKVLDEHAAMPKRPFAVVAGPHTDANGPILGTARVWRTAAGEGRTFFVANVSGKAYTVLAEFRANGQPELWYPATGETEIAAPWVTDRAGYQQQFLTLGPQESVFVTYAPRSVMPGNHRKSRPEVRREKAVTGPWRVSFEPNRGAPEGAETWAKLVSWTDSANFGIKCFSGTATYRARFTLTAEEAAALLSVDLGGVRDIARVRLNGRDLGVAWFAPFAVPSLDAARAGENELEVEVTNGWHNRLIADHNLPGDDCTWGPERYHQCAMDGTKGDCGRGLKRIPAWAWNWTGARPATNRVTFTSWDYFKGDEPLAASGLLGPVTLRLR